MRADTPLERLRAWMRSQGLARIWVYRPENFAWLTGGENTLGMGEPVAWLEVGEEVRVHTSRIEQFRIAEEEARGFTVVTHPWETPPPLARPNDLDLDLTPLRLVLTPDMQDSFRVLGREVALATGEVVREAKPDWREQELAGALAESLWSRGIRPLLLLVAGEERLFRYRHPLPKGRPLGRAFMAVVCGTRHGLVANLTRMAHFGGRPEIRDRYEKVLEVEAAALAASRPGVFLGEVFTVIQKAYTRVGFPDAWREHHQGGVGGYRSREVVATPDHDLRLEEGMVLAWNPSLAGAKVEDTFLLVERGLENLTGDPHWPKVTVHGRARPALLER